MRDLEDEDGGYDYGPNEMVHLERNNPQLYNKIMSQNIGDAQDIENWQQNNLRNAQEYLAQQRRNRR